MPISERTVDPYKKLRSSDEFISRILASQVLLPAQYHSFNPNKWGSAKKIAVKRMLIVVLSLIRAPNLLEGGLRHHADLVPAAQRYL